MAISYLINRINSGILRLKVSLHNGDTYLFKRNPTKEVRYIAEEIYKECLVDALHRDVMPQAEMRAKLYRLGFWTDEKEKEIRALTKDIEAFKIGLYQQKNLTNHQDHSAREGIKLATSKIEKLLGEKYSYDYTTAEGYASICKMRYLVRNSLFTEAGLSEFSPYNTKNLFSLDDLVDNALSCINSMRIEEAEYRVVARSHEWQQIWEGADSSLSLYGIPACDMTLEQTFLYNWSRLYDSISKNPDKPRQSIIDDDDKLDGWLILERRKIEKENIKDEYEKRLTDKTKNSDEVYIIAQQNEEVKEIESLNDVHAQYIKKQRQAVLNKRGQMHDFEFPDVQQKIGMLQNQLDRPKG